MSADIDIQAPILLRDRYFSRKDIKIIKSCVKKNYERGRTRISKEICEKLDWRQPNGWLKDRACREVLRELEQRGYINLPPSLISRKKGNQLNVEQKDLLHVYDLDTPITEFPSNIEFVFVKGNKYEPIWNALIDKYHYLGHSVAVGRSIKYIIKSEDRLIGAIAFSSPAWKLNSRDKILDKLGISSVRDYTISNTRFLILPNVKVPNLASNLLSLSTKKIVIDWSWYYSVTPLIAETFVQPSLFDGACYKAANWIEIGTTKGYAKRGPSYHNSQEPKIIFLYGLTRQLRRKMEYMLKGGELK